MSERFAKRVQWCGAMEFKLNIPETSIIVYTTVFSIAHSLPGSFAYCRFFAVCCHLICLLTICYCTKRSSSRRFRKGGGCAALMDIPPEYPACRICSLRDGNARSDRTRSERMRTLAACQYRSRAAASHAAFYT